MKKLFLPGVSLFFLLSLLFTAPLCYAQVHEGVELVKADLITDSTVVEAGKPFTVGLRLKMAPQWHTYWQYSGDAGLPTQINWELPEGFKAGPIEWPIPEKFVSAGDVINYGYHDEVVLLTEVTPPASFNSLKLDVKLKAKVSWLVCAEICIPGDADVSLDFSKQVQNSTGTSFDADLIKKYKALLPATFNPETSGFQCSAKNEGKQFVISISNLKADKSDQFEFYPLPENPSLDIGHPTVKVDSNVNNEKIQASIPLENSNSSTKAADIKIGGLFVIKNAQGEKQGWLIPWNALTNTNSIQVSSPPSNISKNTTLITNQGSLWHFLLLGFIGGLILNVMPCVLPVISLKIFSFVKQANDNPKRVWRLGVSYVAGIFVWFFAFAALVVGFRAAGHEVGYAFHFQNPLFILGLSAITFLFSLNLLGVYNSILPTNGLVGSAAQLAESQEGYLGAFLQGILATVLASACTAPLFGPALGFAFGQPTPIVFAMFAAISFGMGLPFIILAARPQWLRFLPKPGAWMERAKQLTGFALMATVLWLLMIIGALKGQDAILWTCFFLLMIGLASWIHGTFNVYGITTKTRSLLYLIVIGLIATSGYFTTLGVLHAKRDSDLNSNNLATTAAQPFSKQLEEALKQNRIVFVDFTAQWCVNCKVNERTVLATKEVQDVLKAQNVLFLKADWTDGAADITHLLRQFGRAGVPLYVIYPAGKPDKPIILPELLTTNLVLDALKQAGS